MTIRKADQEAAYAALRRGVLDYDIGAGYRGRSSWNLPNTTGVRTALERIQETSDSEGLLPGGDPGGEPDQVAAVLADGEKVRVTSDGLQFVARSLGGQSSSRDTAATSSSGPAQPRRQAALDGRRPAAAGGATFVSHPAPRRRHRLAGRGFDFDRGGRPRRPPRQRQPRVIRSSRSSTRPRWKKYRPGDRRRRHAVLRPRRRGRSNEAQDYDSKYDSRCSCAPRSRRCDLVTVRVLQAIRPALCTVYVARFRIRSQAPPAS